MYIVQSDDIKLSGPSFVLNYKKALEIRNRKLSRKAKIRNWWSNNLNQVIVFSLVLVAASVYISLVLGN